MASAKANMSRLLAPELSSDRIAACADISSRLARMALASFVITFLLARIIVLLIMSRRMPDLFLNVGQTHVHHLNYGIFMLVAVGAWLLFLPPATVGRARRIAASMYGVGLALTFDEFGMWLHLGGSYWQRASYDAIITCSAMLGLLAFAPNIKRMHVRHVVMIFFIVVLLGACVALAAEQLQRAQPALERLEEHGPR
jgi:hypothetical protein